MRFPAFVFVLFSFICAAAALVASASPLEPRQGSSCSNLQIRREWRRMNHADRVAYLRAERCLLRRPSQMRHLGATNRFEDLQAVHQVLTLLYHDNAAFLPWHRYFLHIHQTLLRNECGYSGPIPWWDETLDSGRFSSAPLFGAAYFGSLPQYVEGREPPCVRDGAFAGTELHIGPGGANQNRRHCLNRAARDADSARVTGGYVERCNGEGDYNRMWDCVYGGPHGYGHVALRGTMIDVAASPGDPVFYLHHAFVDRNWKNWQNRDGRRLSQITGPAASGRRITLDYELTSLGLMPNVTVRDVLNSEGGYLCYRYD